MPSSQENPRSYVQQQNKDFGKLPKYGVPVYSKPERVDDMYPLKSTGFGQSDVQKGMEKVLGSLSLFAPFTHEDVPEENPLQLERPVTPIDEEIKVQPSSFERMARHVRRRIMAQPDVPHVSLEDQRNLAAIIMGEVNGIWPDIRQQIDDPFLTPGENKELNRRISVHIVTVCEHLFNHYLEKALVLNSRGVFSGPANMSRLKAQLALEANDLLNILKIRRYIVSDMRTPEDDQDETEVSERSSKQKRTSSAKKLSYQAMLEASRPKPKQPKHKPSTLDLEIREIQENMPVLDTNQLMDLVAELPDRNIQTPSEEDFQARPSRISEGDSRMSGVSKEDSSRQKILLKRCKSQPHIGQGETLLEELGIASTVRGDRLFEEELAVLHRERNGMHKVKTNQEAFLLSSRDFLRNDLSKLIEEKDDEFPDGDAEDDLPPLIQAITRHARHDDMKERMEKQLQELEENERIREEEECIHVQEPAYPQPDTVNANLGSHGVARTSDIRVSERVCMSSITLKRHATVYNDLQEEIDPVTVKNLDKNLFLSDEIQEVYKEIMKSVPTKHMELDDLSGKDPLVLHAPESINVGGTMASASLAKKVSSRVINPAFVKDKGPPWGEEDMKEWARTPVNPPKNFLGEAIFAPVTPDMAKINEAMNKPKQQDKMAEMMSSVIGVPSNQGAEKLNRTYASWLQWWKSTVTSDDYMKYLSTLETDYMGAVFHFYDSEGESESEDEATTIRSRRFSKRTQSSNRSKHNAEYREKQRKLSELKQIKTDFKDGFWNANAVLMGGLGKEPELADDLAEEKLNMDKVAKSVDSARAVTIQDKTSLRVLPDKRDLISRMSKATTGASEIAAGSETVEETNKPPQPQERLEAIWQQLQMPDGQRLDMAIKYSCNEYFNRMLDAIERWELVTELILQREALIVKLENFERHASDPNRFFNKESKKGSVRMSESRKRTYFYKKIDALDLEIKEEIEFIKEEFRDSITFKGRPYIDKMKWDRTEMLYWLSEERKKQGMKYEAISKGLNLPLKPAKLEPILP